jgi:hypothetical protein
MFNLEQAIAEWRKQMLAAGIKSPVPLEELEIHLHDQIDREIKSGNSEPKAFELAVAKLGQANPLKNEFNKNTRFQNWLGMNVNPCANQRLDWLGMDTASRVNQRLAVLWLILYDWFLSGLAKPMGAVLYSPLVGEQHDHLTAAFWLVVFLVSIFTQGILASIRLLLGKGGRGMILAIVILGPVALVAELVTFQRVSWCGIILTSFNIASLWFPRSPQKNKTVTE